MSDRLTLKQFAERMKRAARVRTAIEAAGPEIAAAAVEETKARMIEGINPDGEPQPPLKSARRSGNPGPPLVDFGDLRESVSAEVSGTTLRITASGPGARRHQNERPFLGASPALKDAIGKLIASKITGGTL